MKKHDASKVSRVVAILDGSGQVHTDVIMLPEYDDCPFALYNIGEQDDVVLRVEYYVPLDRWDWDRDVYKPTHDQMREIRRHVHDRLSDNRNYL